MSKSRASQRPSLPCKSMLQAKNPHIARPCSDRLAHIANVSRGSGRCNIDSRLFLGRFSLRRPCRTFQTTDLGQWPPKVRCCEGVDISCLVTWQSNRQVHSNSRLFGVREDAIHSPMGGANSKLIYVELGLGHQPTCVRPSAARVILQA